MKSSGFLNVLLSCMLLASVFLVSVTTSSSQQEYNPWIDSNEDGVIDILDAIMLANVFGTSGDTTKNVSVTNWPEEQAPELVTVVEDYNMTWESSPDNHPFYSEEISLGTFSVEQYSHMRFLARVKNYTELEADSVRIDVRFYSCYEPFGTFFTEVIEISWWAGYNVTLYGRAPWNALREIAESNVRITVQGIETTTGSMTLSCLVSVGFYYIDK